MMRVGEQLGPYRLDDEVRSDAMGEVWSAYNTSAFRPVTLRVLPDELSTDPAFRERFETDIEAAAGFEHAHIVPIFEYGQLGGRLFIATAPIDGTDLETVLEQSGPMNVFRAVMLVEQVASALDAAHEVGVTHGDVSPRNVLLHERGFVYLWGLGLGGATNGKSDVRGLAEILYTCLTARRPSFNGAPPRASSVIATLPPALDDVVARGMGGEDTKPYPSPGALAAAARAALGTRGTAPIELPTRRIPLTAPVVEAKDPESAIPDSDPEPEAVATAEAKPPSAAAPIAAGIGGTGGAAGTTGAAGTVDWRRRGIIAAVVLGIGVLVGIVAGLVLGSSATMPTTEPTSAPAPTVSSLSSVSSASSASSVSQAPAGSTPPAAPVAPPPTFEAPTPPVTEEAPAPPRAQPQQPAPSPVPPPAPSPIPPPPPPADPPGVLPCYPGYVHTPAPDGPCLPPGQGQVAPPPAQPVPPRPAPQQPQAPQVLPCYPGYSHQPAPNGPCLPA